MDFVMPHVKSIKYSIQSIRVFVPKMWESLPRDVKNEESVDRFKTSLIKGNQTPVLAVFVKHIHKT